MDTVDYKQPWEGYRQPVDFTAFLGAAEVINAISEVAVELLDSAGAVVSDESETMWVPGNDTFSSDMTTANIYIEGGEDGNRYKVTCRVTGTLGSKYELEFVLPVREI